MVLFVIFDTETATRSCPGVAVPGDYLPKKYEKYPSSILSIKVAFIKDSFCNHLEIF